MNDNIFSAFTGSVTTVVYTLITWADVWKIALSGLIGGALGYIGKKLGEYLVSQFKKLVENLKKKYYERKT